MNVDWEKEYKLLQEGYQRQLNEKFAIAKDHQNMYDAILALLMKDKMIFGIVALNFLQKYYPEWLNHEKK